MKHLACSLWELLFQVTSQKTFSWKNSKSFWVAILNCPYELQLELLWLSLTCFEMCVRHGKAYKESRKKWNDHKKTQVRSSYIGEKNSRFPDLTDLTANILKNYYTVLDSIFLILFELVCVLINSNIFWRHDFLHLNFWNIVQLQQ